MLETVPDFATVDEPKYSVDNLEETCRSIQREDRKNEQSNPYLKLIMKSTSPLDFRKAGNRAYEKHVPQAAALSEEQEITQMRSWQAIWRYEVQLLRTAPFTDFHAKADAFEKELDAVKEHLVKENSNRFSLRKVSSAAQDMLQCAKSFRKSESPSPPKRGRSATPGGQLKPQQLLHPPSKPELKLTTKGMSPPRGGGTSTPGKAQYLDADGFLSPRPRTPTPPKTPSP
ncbi:MAG: hypothetical protein LQ340_003657 [Diploschistes diacapsis]|nr:MAG: hypothetical protein LQ340_003657 [Diploschistes diacapsis]